MTWKAVTWNLDGRWTPSHLALLEHTGATTWLLTEVPDGLAPPSGWTVHRSAGTGRGNAYAAVVTRGPSTALEVQPHRGSVLVEGEGVLLCASVLPWRSATGPDWPGERQAGRTRHAVDVLELALRGATEVVWGGDWNHELEGRLWAGSVAGQRRIEQALEALRLDAVTRWLPAPTGDRTIDHVAVPASWGDPHAERVAARGLSDHDAYLVRAVRP